MEETELIYMKLPTRQILFVEDGSVDLDESLKCRNLLICKER